MLLLDKKCARCTERAALSDATTICGALEKEKDVMSAEDSSAFLKTRTDELGTGIQL